MLFLTSISNSSSHWQRKSKASTPSRVALHFYPPSVRLHHLLDNGQAKTRAASSASAGRINAVETFKEVW